MPVFFNIGLRKILRGNTGYAHHFFYILCVIHTRYGETEEVEEIVSIVKPD
jgi:hypothetical protein